LAEAPIIIITGAGSGIGRASCARLALQGAALTLVGRRNTALHETATLMRQQNRLCPNPLIFAGDVAQQKTSQNVIDETLAKRGRVDALINNAAMALMQPINVTDETMIRQTFSTNTFGPAYLIAACWPHFVRQGGGRVVNVSSVSTIDPFPGLAMYAASKAALESLTRSVMIEGKPHNILGFTIVLGAVETRMLRQVVSAEALPAASALQPDEAAKIIVACATGQRDADAGQPLIVRKT
jgi:NAD(P)-dependent dehydrogenase (short-subunit alcohol dehydrogenase family)